MTFDLRPFRDLYPFNSHWLQRGGLRLHYLDEGAGEPLVCLHGNPTWSFHFRRIVLAFRDTHRVVVPDHIGCGLSDKPSDGEYEYTLERRVEDLEALLNHLELDGNVTLIVHDWGGMIGAAWALRKPERVARLVILNTAAFLKPTGMRLPFSLWFVRSVPLLPSLLVRGLNAFALGAARMATHKGLSPDVRAAYTAPYNSWKNRIATLRFVQDIPLSPHDRSYEPAKWVDEHLHRLRGLPMLICWGERDFVFDADYLAEWQRRFPEAEVHTFADAGHYVLEDAGDQIVPLIRDFLARHPLPKVDAQRAEAVS